MDTKRMLRDLSMQLNQWYSDRRFADLGEPFVDEDWDVLVILDACRPEFLYDCVLPEGVRSTRYSAGSGSWEFMEANFEGRTLHDTIYITANPHAYKLSPGIFFEVRNLLEDSWDEELGTVKPTDVTAALRKAARKYPNKRLIAHYMQPHFPFIGEKGRRIDRSAIPPENPGPDRPGEPAPWTRLEDGGGDVSRAEVIEAYKENHEVVAAELFDVLDAVRGKVVVTADHANLIGDRAWPIPIRMYGHLEGFAHPKLRHVPWMEIENGPRPTIESDSPVDTELERDPDHELVEERLRDLGYA